jgi:RNA polymerase sigma factor (sigma-70 family)
MIEIPETSVGGADARESASMIAPEVDTWFAREVLPLEAALMQFLQHNWRNKSDVADLRQDIYVLVYESALKQIPDKPKQFVFATARNLLVNRVRREQIVPIEAVADLDALDVAMDEPSPDRQVIARDELKHLQTALDRLTPRCREAVVLGRIEGLSGVEIAERMGITRSTVSRHLTDGLAALADMIHGEAPESRVKS